MASERTWDIVVLGATGYTGRCAVQHIYATLPTNTKWAVAGRSSNKLIELVSTMQKAHPDRVHPGIEVVDFTKESLDALAKKTRIIINGVGPYHIYSTPVVEACASNGTHYVDVTGETPWVYDLIERYEETAKSSGAIIVPEVGLESLPTDLVSYMLASYFRKTYNADLQHATNCVWELKSGGFSGGTLLTVITIFEDYPLSKLAKSFGNHYSLSPEPPKNPHPSTRPWYAPFTGVFSCSPFGLLTTSPSAVPNIVISHRSAGFLRSLYGPSFRVEEYLRVTSRVRGMVLHYVLLAMSVLLTLAPFRWLMRRIITQPGFGPSEEANKMARLDMRALGVAKDPSTGKEVKAVAKLLYKQHLYYMSGLLMVECASTILANEKNIQNRFGGGGLLTPACLADSGDLMDRLEKAGFELEVQPQE